MTFAVVLPDNALLADDLPSIPLWSGRQVAGYSEAVKNVRFSPLAFLVLADLELS